MTTASIFNLQSGMTTVYVSTLHIDDIECELDKDGKLTSAKIGPFVLDLNAEQYAELQELAQREAERLLQEALDDEAVDHYLRSKAS